MSLISLAPSRVVSPKVYALILDSPRLRQTLLPQGMISSPYQVLDYQAVLMLKDPEGREAVFHRTQRVQFLQDGVSAILDHAWGDGVLVTNYLNSAGPLADSFKDEGRRHLVVGLKRPMGSGEVLAFAADRTIMEGFRAEEEWWQISIDHPVRRLKQTVIFPKARPCQQAVLYDGKTELVLPVLVGPRGQTMVRFTIPQPLADVPYTVVWKW